MIFFEPASSDEQAIELIFSMVVNASIGLSDIGLYLGQPGRVDIRLDVLPPCRSFFHTTEQICQGRLSNNLEVHQRTYELMQRVLIALVHQQLLGGSQTLNAERVDMGIPINEQSKHKCSLRVKFLGCFPHIPKAVGTIDEGSYSLVLLGNRRASKDQTCKVRRKVLILDDEQTTQKIGRHSHCDPYPMFSIRTCNG